MNWILFWVIAAQVILGSITIRIALAVLLGGWVRSEEPKNYTRKIL